jgi:hypothetical protein
MKDSKLRRIIMSFELNIISLGQCKVTKFRENISIIVENEIENDEARYFEIWPFMCKAEGIWYTLGVIYRGFFNAVPICASDFDSNINSLPIPEWITDESVKESLTPLIIKEPYKKEFKEIIELLINDSPQKTIMFHSRYECPDHEIIQGVMSLDNFWSLLEQKKILFNICYIIRI